MLKQSLFALSCIAALAAGPLGAQAQSPAMTPSAPESRTSPGAINDAQRIDAPHRRTIDEPAARPGGRVSETAPAPRAGWGEARFRADLASCNTVEPESRASCRQEMHAARAQGLYRN